MSDCITTARIAPAYGPDDLAVYFYPDEREDSSPVWIKQDGAGFHVAAALTLSQAQELAAGLHKIIAAKL